MAYPNRNCLHVRIRPGIEPGPRARYASVIPLDQRSMSYTTDKNGSNFKKIQYI